MCHSLTSLLKTNGDGLGLAWRNGGGWPLGAWCTKMKLPGVCMCVCYKKLQYGSNGKKVLLRHQSEDAHKAAFRSVKHTSSLPGASSTTIEIWASMADRVCDHKVHICTFLAKQDLPLTLLQPLMKLIKSVANDQSTLSKLSISNAHASYLCTAHMALVRSIKQNC